MYKEIETPAIAKKRYYFKKGYRQVTIAQKDEVDACIRHYTLHLLFALT